MIDPAFGIPAQAGQQRMAHGMPPGERSASSAKRQINGCRIPALRPE